MIAITAKEIRLLLRSRRAFWLLLAALLTLGGVFGLMWAQMSREGYQTIGRRALLGRQLFMFISLVQLCAMGLIAPLTAATAVSGEREAGTLELLFCTGLSRFSLLFGKWGATVWYECMLLVCALPVLALVFQLGGVGADEYLYSALLIAAAVLAYGMLGVACSCLFKKSIKALTAALLVVLFFGLGLPLLLLFLDEFGIIDFNLNGRSGNMQSIFDFLFWAVSPLFMFIRRLNSSMFSRTGFVLLRDPYFIAHLIFQFVLLVVSFLVARRAFVRIGAEGPGHALDALAATAQRRRWPFLRFLPFLLSLARGMFSPLISPRPQVIPDGVNPIHARACSISPWLRLLARMALFTVPVSLLFYDVWDDSNPNDIALFATFLSLSLVLLFTPIFAATAVARERDERTMDLLRVTPLGAWAIVRGKFRAALRPSLAIALTVLIMPALWRGFYVLDRILQFRRGIGRRNGLPPDFYFGFLFPFFRVLVLVFVFCALFTAVGIFISTFQRRGAAAMVAAYVLLFAMTVAVPFLTGLVAYELADKDDLVLLWVLFRPVAAFLCPLVSPYYYLTMTGEGHRHLFVFWSRNYDPNADPGGWMLILVHGALVLVLAHFILRAAAWRLAREK